MSVSNQLNICNEVNVNEYIFNDINGPRCVVET